MIRFAIYVCGCTVSVIDNNIKSIIRVSDDNEILSWCLYLIKLIVDIYYNLITKTICVQTNKNIFITVFLNNGALVLAAKIRGIVPAHGQSSV